MKSRSGFTIVELLIVIVVIAILAAISIVAYNGMQTRAENTKTINAVSAWVKALQLYKADKGVYPTTHSCLGDTNTYADSHNGRCWGLNSDGAWFVNSTFLSQMSDYIGSTYPSPSNKDINAGTGGNQFRGAMYYVQAVGNEMIYLELIGGTSTANCPKVGSLTYTGGAVRPNGVTCYYTLPQ